MKIPANIYLIGIMGAGKTTVGKKLAEILGFEFIDVDQEIIRRTGVSISHIFEVESEQGFRDRESHLLQEISERSRQVVSTGGGIVVRQENQSVMRGSGTVVYLNVPIGVLWNRLKGCQHRPLLQGPDPRNKLKEMMQVRAPMYAEASNIEITVHSDSAIKTAHKIKDALARMSPSDTIENDTF